MTISHPYFPQDSIINNYVPNTIPVINILLGFFGFCAILLYSGWSFTASRKLSSLDRWTFNWFLLCGCIHTFLEGYYVTHASKIAGLSTVFAQIWKEYAHSDSRYLTNDPTVWTVEALCSFLEGPGAFMAAYAILNKKNYRHAYQLLVSFGQLYGCVLYYASSYLDNFKDSNPAPQYFYGYFVLMNLPWIIIPTLLSVSSVKAMNKAFDFQQKSVKKAK